jgi:hypothetical protein
VNASLAWRTLAPAFHPFVGEFFTQSPARNFEIAPAAPRHLRSLEFI